MPTVIWWTIKKLLRTSDEPPIDASVEQQIACYRRPGFKDPRQKEIERRMRDYLPAAPPSSDRVASHADATATWFRMNSQFPF